MPGSFTRLTTVITAARQRSGKGVYVHFLEVICAVTAVGAIANWPTTVTGQTETLFETVRSNFEDPAAPLPQLPRIELCAVVGNTAYVCWPRSLVGEATLTAVDLKTKKLKWSHPFGKQVVQFLTTFGDQIYCVADRQRVVRPGRLVSDVTDTSFDNESFESIHDYLFQVETGKLTTLGRLSPEKVIYGKKPVIDGNFLVGDLVIDATDLRSYELDFESSNALIQKGKLFVVFWEYVRNVETKASPDEEKGDGSSENTDTRGLFAAGGDLQIPYVRRVDLKTGNVEVTARLPGSKGEPNARWTLVAADGDRIYLQEHEVSYAQRDDERTVTCYDIVQEQQIWSTVVPRELSNLRFRDPTTLEDQPRTRQDSGAVSGGSYVRHPLLIDASTGRWQPDPDWRDPYSFIHWHTNIDSIVQVMKNDRYIVVLHKDAALICIDSVTGQRLWRGEAATPWPPFSEVLTDQLVLPCLGGIDIYDVATGQCHRLLPKDVGLKVERSLELPTNRSANRDPTLTHASSDKFYERQLVLLLALPVVGWICFRTLFWLRRPRSKADVTS